MKYQRLAICAVLVSLLPLAGAQSVTPVAAVDKLNLTGSWHEIARLPNRREKHCASDAIELIALGDKPSQLQLVDACTDIKGYKDSWNFIAFDKTHNGALKVRTFFPFTRKYWILALGPIVPGNAPAASPAPAPAPIVANPASDSTTSAQPDPSPAAPSTASAASPAKSAPPPPPTGYAWSLIGSPNHKQLWIFARSATLDPSTLDQIKAQASAMGFASDKLTMTRQALK